MLGFDWKSAITTAITAEGSGNDLHEQAPIIRQQ